MDKIYKYDTIEECEKAIALKTEDLDIAFCSNFALFECFVRTIRTIMWWIIMLVPVTLRIFYNFKAFIISLAACIIIYIIGALLMSWVKFNYRNTHSNTKIAFVRGMISKCKEYDELIESEEVPEWQKKQVTRRMARRGEIDVTWDNDK